MNKTIKVNERINEELERIKVAPTRRIDLSEFSDLETTNKESKKE